MAFRIPASRGARILTLFNALFFALFFDFFVGLVPGASIFGRTSLYAQSPAKSSTGENALPGDPGVWSRPVLLEKNRPGKDAIIVFPWGVHVYKENIYAAILAVGVGKKIRLRIYQSSDRGETFRRLSDINLDRVPVPPTLLFRGKYLEGVLTDAGRNPYFIRVNLETGEAQDKTMIAAPAPVDDLVFPMLFRRGKSLYYLCAGRGRGADLKLYLLTSDDNGAEWRREKTDGWKHKKRRGGRPVIFATGALLHVVARESGASGLTHYLRPLDGRRWIKSSLALPASEKNLSPLGAVYDGEQTLFLYYASKTYFARSAVYAARDVEHMSKWSGRVRLMKRMNPMVTLLSRLAHSGRRVLFLSSHRPDPLKNLYALTALFSLDGGRTWSDISFPHSSDSSAHFAAGIPGKKGKEALLIYLEVARPAKKAAKDDKKKSAAGAGNNKAENKAESKENKKKGEKNAGSKARARAKIEFRIIFRRRAP